MRKIVERFFSPLYHRHFIGSHTPGCTNKMGVGEPGRAQLFGILAGAKTRRWGLGVSQRGNRKPVSQVQLVWQKDPQGEMTGHRNSVSATLYPSPSFPKKSLGWILFLYSLTKRGMSIIGRGEIGPTPTSVSIIMGTHP